MAATRKSAKRTAGKKRRSATRSSSTKRSSRKRSSKKRSTKSSVVKAAKGGLETVRQAGEKTWETLKSTTAHVVEGVRDRI